MGEDEALHEGFQAQEFDSAALCDLADTLRGVTSWGRGIGGIEDEGVYMCGLENSTAVILHLLSAVLPL